MFDYYIGSCASVERLLIQRLDITNEFYKTAVGTQQLKDLQKHFAPLVKISHENVIELYGAYIESRHESQSLNIVLEYFDATLESLLEIAGSFSFEKSKTFMNSLLAALEFLHSNQIIHNAITTRNIVFSNYVPKFVNMQFLKHLVVLNDNVQFSEHILCEQPVPTGWRSPESLSEFFVCSEHDDLFCLARTFLEVEFNLM